MIPIQYFHTATTGTTVIAAAGRSMLVGVNVNTIAGGSTISIYDGQSASGKLVAAIDGGSAVSKGYLVMCKTGITVVVSGGSPDVTVAFV